MVLIHPYLSGEKKFLVQNLSIYDTASTDLFWEIYL